MNNKIENLNIKLKSLNKDWDNLFIEEESLQNEYPQPDYNYILAMTPRSGSTYLCNLLTENNLFNLPYEALNPWNLSTIFSKRNYSPCSPINYLCRLRSEISTTNNIFGIKTNFDHFDHFVKAGCSQFFGKFNFIFLFRENIIKQAVSCHLTEITQIFHSHEKDYNHLDEITKGKSYNLNKVLHWIKVINNMEAEWLNFFSENNVDYLEVSYEKFIKNKENTLKEICGKIGIQEPEIFLLEGNLKSMTTDLNKKIYNDFLNSKSLMKEVETLSISKSRT